MPTKEEKKMDFLDISLIIVLKDKTLMFIYYNKNKGILTFLAAALNASLWLISGFAALIL